MDIQAMPPKKWVFRFNSPVVLSFFILSLLILLGSTISGGKLGDILALQFTGWNTPLQYIRLFTYSVTHKTLEHFTGNMLMFLIVGPMVEEKYGSISLGIMVFITSAITGLIHLLLFPNVLLLGASGIVFMLILLGSFVNIQERSIPLTFIIVGLLYIGSEILHGIFTVDNISQLSHILGGAFGVLFGFVWPKKQK